MADHTKEISYLRNKAKQLRELAATADAERSQKLRAVALELEERAKELAMRRKVGVRDASQPANG
jgi:hypothetical protein